MTGPFLAIRVWLKCSIRGNDFRSLALGENAKHIPPPPRRRRDGGNTFGMARYVPTPAKYSLAVSAGASLRFCNSMMHRAARSGEL
jgi:hypothetical protein